MVDKWQKMITSSSQQIQRNQIVIIDFDIYMKAQNLRDSIFYIYIDSLPITCTNRLKNFKEKPIAIKHQDLYVLVSV